ncbi:MAG: DUF6328 family protein [Ilumatobacteraceae bacterium]
MTADDVSPPLDDDVPSVDADSALLDDVTDREELRQRYYGLLQELRVVLPGVQVLLAFLLTAPFAQRFGEMDDVERRTFGIALTSSMFSVILLLSPTFLHRLGDRRARAARLQWSTRLMTVGLVMLGISLVTAMWAIARFVFGAPWAWVLISPIIVTMVLLWVLLPLTLHRRSSAA